LLLVYYGLRHKKKTSNFTGCEETTKPITTIMCGQCVNESDHFMKFASFDGPMALECKPVLRKMKKKIGTGKKGNAQEILPTTYPTLPVLPEQTRNYQPSLQYSLTSYLRDVDPLDAIEKKTLFVLLIEEDILFARKFIDEWNEDRSNHIQKYFILTIFPVSMKEPSLWKEIHNLLFFQFFDILPDEWNNEKFLDLLNFPSPTIDLMILSDDLKLVEDCRQYRNEILSNIIDYHHCTPLNETERISIDNNPLEEGNGDVNQNKQSSFMRFIHSFLSSLNP
jgi:hypothetical protein